MPPPSHTAQLPAVNSVGRQRPKSPSRILAEAEAQWLFTEAEIQNTPSVQDGMSIAEERDLRAKGVNFIIQVGLMLKLPQLTLSTAPAFFQRFLMRASLKLPRSGIPKLHHYQIAATCLFLATKVEESCRKMKEMILAFCRVAQKNPNLVVDEQSKDFWKWRDCILHHEDVVLETLCFDLTVESPHRQLFELLKQYGVENNKRLRNQAWGLVTDANNTQLPLLCSSRTIAIAGIYAACRYSEVALPDDLNGRPWWEVQGVRLKDVKKAVEHMCASYESSVNKTDGGSQGSEGGGSIYASLATPVDGNAGGWDATRIREEDKKDIRSPDLQAPGSERRLSNAGSVGVKRERKEDQQYPRPASRNGDALVPVKSEKRQRLNDPALQNGQATTAGAFNGLAPPPAISMLVTPASALPKDDDVAALNDQKHREERLRVANGNKQVETAVQAAEAAEIAEPEADVGSEEGEVDE